MIRSNSREVEDDSPTKDHHQEAPTITNDEGNVGTKLFANSTSSSSICTPWLRLKDPRIVRVSRAFGGKDRHSKVCTIRGLRDRRVRLSVPTAIQLYDLQDRLGLNQPSKVVDWLLNAAKREIDELPPLPINPGSFGFTYHQPVTIASTHHHEVGSSSSQLSKEGFKLDKGVEWEELPRPTSMWNMSNEKEVARDINIPFGEKENWMNRHHEENKEEDNEERNNNNTNNVHVSSSSFLSRGGQSSSTGNLVNNGGTYGASFFNFEAPNFNTPHHLGSHVYAHHLEDPHGLNETPLPSTLSLSSNYFPTSTMEFDPSQITHFQMLASSTQLPNPDPYSINQSMRPLQISVSPRRHIEDDEDKDQNFHGGS